MKPLLRHFTFVFLGIILAALLAFALTKASHVLFPRALPDYGVVPPFELIERSGKPIDEKNLLGSPWVADFIYTTCPGPCPVLTQRMGDFQKSIDHRFLWRLVSFSVDPTADTPAVLSIYANHYLAEPERWLFVTGNPSKMYDLIQNGFHLPVVENKERAPGDENRFIHTTKMVLIDRHGKIRGYYDGLDDVSLQQLRRDLIQLIHET